MVAPAGCTSPAFDSVVKESRTPRPRSSRFVRATLGKLQEDSDRVAGIPFEAAVPPRPSSSWSRATTCSPGQALDRESPVPESGRYSVLDSGRSSALDNRGSPSPDWEHWRRLFHEDVRDYLQSVKSALNEVNLPETLSQLVELRRADQSQAAQLRDELGDLLKSSTPARQGSADWLSGEELCRLKELLRSSVTPVNDMAQAVRRLAATQEAEAHEAAKLRCSLAEDRGRRGLEDRRWACLLQRVDELQDRFERLEERALRQGAQATEQLLLRLPEQVEERVRHALEDLSGVAVGLCPAVPQSGRKAVTPDLGQEDRSPRRQSAVDCAGSVRRKNSAMSNEDFALGGVADFQSMMGSLERQLEEQSTRLDEQLRKVSSAFSDGVAKLHQESEHWHVKYDGARAEVRTWRNNAEEAQGECSRLRSELEDVRDTLSWSQQKLRALNTAPTLKLAQRIREIESHGNISLNLHSGEVGFLRPLQFASRRTSEEPSTFADPDVAQGVMRDLANLAIALASDVTIQGRASGGSDASGPHQSVAASRARFVKDQLASLGVDRKRLLAKGLTADLGGNRAAVSVKFDLPATVS